MDTGQWASLRKLRGDRSEIYNYWEYGLDRQASNPGD